MHQQLAALGTYNIYGRLSARAGQSGRYRGGPGWNVNALADYKVWRFVGLYADVGYTRVEPALFGNGKAQRHIQMMMNYRFISVMRKRNCRYIRKEDAFQVCPNKFIRRTSDKRRIDFKKLGKTVDYFCEDMPGYEATVDGMRPRPDAAARLEALLRADA